MVLIVKTPEVVLKIYFEKFWEGSLKLKHKQQGLMSIILVV